jgi:ABC-type uncharacterized transport system permease subunit
LKVAGWLAMASAFLTLPLIYLSFRLESRLDLTATAIQTIIQIFGIILFVAIVLYLKRLLNSHFKFHSTDRTIDLMIIANVVTGFLSVATLYFAPFKESIGSVVIAILVIQGIVQIRFGYKLLKLPHDFGGMLKPFCYANMATGILLASIVLIPLGIVVSAISDLMLGTIFLDMSKLISDDDSGQ